jgi:hypothetical protein
MGKEAAKWLRQVEPHFGFLPRFGFTTIDVDDSSLWSTWVQYRSDTSAIRIELSREFVRSEVHLIRLVNGDVPAYPIWITDDRIDWALLDNVVEVRQPSLMAEVRMQTGLTSNELDRQLRFWAHTLREVAWDFVAGNFAPLGEAATVIRSRAAEHPQRVQVWLPEEAPKSAEDQEVSAVRAQVPPNVGVSVRRYRRGLRPKLDRR